MQVHSLSYVDIQHNTLTVIDDVEQGVVVDEDIWVSCYQAGSSSVHGKVKVYQSNGQLKLLPRDGVEIERLTNTSFKVSFHALGVHDRLVRFPKHVVSPPKNQKPQYTDFQSSLHINSVDEHSGNVVVGGSDGYAAIIPHEGEPVLLEGHVGDVLVVKWFPSGKVILTASSDLSLRIYSDTGLNPRILRGHTRAITSLHILSVGREVLSASKDGTIRLWHVGESQQVRRWDTQPRTAIEGIVVIDAPFIRHLGVEGDQAIITGLQDGELEIFPWSGEGRRIKAMEGVGKLNCISYDGRETVVTGHTDGTVILRRLSDLQNGWCMRRNQSPIYSLAVRQQQTPRSTPPTSSPLLEVVGKTVNETVEDVEILNLYIGTAAGLPARLRFEWKEGWTVKETDELAGWEAESVESIVIASSGEVWCAGGQGCIRRY
ncbi:hypothetical protein M231_04261 [Tremella mesenterica]|uniref:Uncharacterized protein n=1 Tax=Tremella mesenterica TaxID=5217 RepID=A0A4Q1BL39_TREME|nr:hypothetical protein M231_04261 [Tremella mesenterica]